MRLLEFEAKKLVTELGIKVPKGITFQSIEELKEGVKTLTPPYILKVQVPIVGRALKGGVKKAYSIEEALKSAEELLANQFNGYRVKYVLIEELIPHEEEYYLSLTVSRPDRKVILLASPHGGVEVESISGKPLIKETIDPLIGLRDFQSLEVAKKIGVKRELVSKLSKSITKMYELLIEKDLLLFEINPLVVSNLDGDLYALDVKVEVDEDSSFRQKLGEYVSLKAYKSFEEEVAEKYRFSYVELSGDIAVIGNGAGLVMATLDLVSLFGGSPSCFIDVGGGASSERVFKAVEIALRKNPKIILINIFAGITRCDEIATGLVKAVEKLKIPPEKLVVRLIGTNEEEGREILSKEGISSFKEMEEAVKKAVELI